MKTGPRAGFVLAEFILALVFVAVALGPLLLFASRIHELNSAISQQSRREAWRSFTDQAIALGMEPSRTPALAPERNPGVPRLPPPPVREISVSAAPGLPRVIPLQAVLDAAVAEPREAGSGYHLGSGASIAPLGPPQPPLPPIILGVPEVTPPDGSVIAISMLRAGRRGEPFTLPIQVSSAGTDRIQMRLNQPAVTLSSTGTAQRDVTASELLNRVNGVAWAEYAGDPSHGDCSVQLDDGRKRWLVATADGRRQTYDPSPVVAFAYQLDLGAPVFVSNDQEIPAGAVLAVNYARFAAVQRGTALLRVDFPGATKGAFGDEWPAASIGFSWTFGSAAGPFSGDARPFFQPDALALWSDSIPVAASPVLPEGGTAASAAWTITRAKTPLGVPVLSTSADSGGFFRPGALQFSAPLADGVTIGRLSFESGAYVSTGTTLSVELTP